MSLLARTVDEAASRFGDRTALVTPSGQHRTYAELAEDSRRVAGGLAARGLGTGDVLGLVARNGATHVTTYLAADRLGATTAAVNARLDPPTRAALLARVDPTVVVAQGPLEQDLDDRLAVVVVVEDDPVAALDGPPVTSVPDDDPDRPVAVVFTSGTTGQPRGAVFTDRQLDGIRRIDAGDGWGWGGPMLVSTEPAHVGVMTKLCWYLRAGMTMHQLDRWRAADALDVIERERLASVGGIPAQVALLLREPDLDERDLSSVQVLITGGAPVPPALLDEATRRFGAGFSVRYSSTESGGVGCGTDPADLAQARRGVGRPRPGVEVRVVDDAGAALPPGEEGRVALRSDAVMAGYWQDPVATAATLVDGWLHTSDLGVLDESGELRLVGRASDMWIRGGENVHPERVEAALLDHPAVAAIAVVPRDDEVMGEVGVALVVASAPDAPPSLASLREFGAAVLARHELPEDVVVVDALPLTSLHKLDRSACCRLTRI